MSVIPQPTGQFHTDEATWRLPPCADVDLGGFDPWCLEAFFERLGLQILNGGNPDVRLVRQPDLGPEAYVLDITADGVEIHASEERGVLWALTTAYQLVGSGLDLPWARIEDSPRHNHRGLSLDCARHFFSADEVKRIIEQMSLVKMNVLHWHLTDDQGWRIATTSYPELHHQHGDDYYSQDDIRDVVAFARSRGVEVIPEIDMPGHMMALLAQYPQYSCSGQPVPIAETGGIFPIILCAGSEETYTLIESLLDEICPLFDSPRFHIGGDEAPKREWKTCGKCQKAIRDHGLANEEELQGYFTNRVVEMLAARGKQAICWNDALVAKNLTRDVTIQYWTVQNSALMRPFIDDGGRWIESEMFTYYFDYPHSMTPLRRVYGDPLAIGDIDHGDDPALDGVEACVWTEHLREPHALEEKLFPRLYAVAEVGWARTHDYEDFCGRLVGFLDRFHPASMGCVAQSRWDPTGDERRAETFAHLEKMNTAMSPEERDGSLSDAAPDDEFEHKFIETFFDPEDLPTAMAILGIEP